MGTYRTEIQKMILNLQAEYDKAGYLRDNSDEEGHEAFNQVRLLLPPVWEILQNYDNQISDSHGAIEV